VQWQHDERFPVPSELKEKYQLCDRAFDVKLSSAYPKETAAVLSGQHQHEPNLYFQSDIKAMKEFADTHMVTADSRADADFEICVQNDINNFSKISPQHDFSRVLLSPASSFEKEPHQCHHGSDQHEHERRECAQPLGPTTIRPMGTISSNCSTQFALSCPRRCHDVASRERHASHRKMEEVDGQHGKSSGGEPHQLQEVGIDRNPDEKPGITTHEVSPHGQPAAGEVFASHGNVDIPLQPVRRLDNLREMPSSDHLHIKEINNHERTKGEGSTSYPGGSISHKPHCGRSDGEHAGPEHTAGPGSDPDQQLSAGACARPKPADHDECNAAASVSNGHAVLGRGDGEPKQLAGGRGVRWPTWMLLSSSMSVASMVSWSQCSTELQKLLLQHNLDENAVVFRHCPKSLRPEPFEDCGELSHWRQVCHGFQECQDAIGCHSAKVCPDPTECPGDSLCHVSPVCPGFQECQDAIECHSAKVCPDSTECPGGSLCHGPKECAASYQCAGGAVHGTESVSSCKPVRPKWLPSYIQCKEALVNDVTEIMFSFSDGWQLLWLQMYDLDTGVCLEDGPRTQGAATFAKPRSVRARCWGLPTSLLSVLQLADNDSNIAVFDEHGDFSEQGPFWAFKASVWRQEIGDEDDCCEQKVRQHDEDHSHKNLTWLARRATDVSGQSKLDFVKLFSPPRVTPIARDRGLRVDTSQIFDLKHGWDVRKKAHRVKFRKFRKDRKPRMLMASPECRAFTQWRHLNRRHMSEQTLKRDLEEGHLQWNFSLEAARDQLADGLHFGLEHPQGAETWELPQTQKLLARDDVALMTFDQCAFGLRVQEGSDRLSRKSTKIATSNPWLAYLLLQAQCSGDHEHLHLEGNYTKKAQEYPPDLCRAIVLSTEHIVSGMIAPSFMQPLSQSETYKDSEKTLQSFFGEEEEEEEITTPIEAREDSRLPLPQLTDSQKRLVRKVHVNTGHSDRHRMLRAFKAAGALPQVLRFVRDEFQCEDCDLKQKTDARRRAQLPRTFSFNKILSVDFLYIRFQEKQIPIFNMVCVGTSYQVAVRAPVPDGSHGGTPTSSTAWRVFLESWVRYFGMPQVIICDSGNEFKSMFERGLELYGVYQHVIHPECPWENGKGERHGGWLKNRLDSEIHGGRCVFTNLPELDEFLSSLTATKNRWLSKGGYTPAQLVFGELPRVPGELLSEDELGNHGLRDAFEDPGEVDEAAGEYRRRHAVRERGRQCAMEQSSREAIIHAQKAAHHPNRHWSVGQWVYVFRRARQSQDLHLRDRWVGPGIVVMTNNDTVYVGMRTRLWRCSASQLRAALPSEVLGRDLMSDPGLAELLRQVISGTNAGAVDVAREGPPPPQHELNPVQRVEDGVEIAQDPALQLPPSSAEAPEQPSEAAPQQMPQPVEPVPPGLGREISQPWIDQLPEAPPGLAPMTHEQPLTTSRRSSVEEPAAEPPVPTSQMDSIAEEPLETESTSPVAEPPWKAARLDEMSSEIGAGASSSTQPPLQPEGAHSTSTTRAPGTPVARLLRSIPSIQGDLPPLPPTLDSDEEEERQQAFSTEGWSGTYFNYRLGDDTWCSDRQGGWALLAAPKRGGEINLKDLSTEERKMFDEADKLEWQAILNTKAVHVIGKKEADKIRQRFPDRIISSRMVRRKKPQPELHSWKAKSRWCLHGHCDPDTGTLSTYAPTPQAEGIMMFLQTGLNLQMQFAFGDVKNAFCQSFPLRRPRGPLYAEPCEGLHLPPGSLIAIDVPVYGLDDAPAAWRTTVATYLVEDLGFERNLVEPCWYSKFDEHGQCVAQILVEVDDFIIAAQKNHYGSIKESLTNRFKFGKWEESEAEYAGRHIKCTPDCIYVDQSKYIIEQIHPVALQKGRCTQKNSQLTAEEFNALRSLTFKFNWLGRETRPEAAGLASIMASRLPNATIEDVGIANKFANYLRSTADRTLKLWKFDPHTMCFIAISDAGGINTKGSDLLDDEGLPADATQGAWIVLAAETLPEGKQRVRASPITWRSSKLKRKVFSTFGGETQAMLQGVNEVDWLQVMYRDAVHHDVQLSCWRNSLSPHMIVLRGQCSLGGRQQQCSVTDAKSLFDRLLRENPSGKQDRKSALELAIVLRDLQSTKSMVRWVPHQKMVVDPLTKLDPARGNDALNQFLKSGWLSLVDVKEEMNQRKSDVAFRRRSHSASHKRLQAEYEANVEQLFCQLLVNNSWGDCGIMTKDDIISIDQKTIPPSY